MSFEVDASVHLLTAVELAERWRVPRSHVYRLTREGCIPTVRLGRYYRYRLDVIQAFEVGRLADEPTPGVSFTR